MTLEDSTGPEVILKKCEVDIGSERKTVQTFAIKNLYFNDNSNEESVSDIFKLLLLDKKEHMDKLNKEKTLFCLLPQLSSPIMSDFESFTPDNQVVQPSILPAQPFNGIRILKIEEVKNRYRATLTEATTLAQAEKLISSPHSYFPSPTKDFTSVINELMKKITSDASSLNPTAKTKAIKFRSELIESINTLSLLFTKIFNKKKAFKAAFSETIKTFCRQLVDIPLNENKLNELSEQAFLEFKNQIKILENSRKYPIDYEDLITSTSIRIFDCMLDCIEVSLASIPLEKYNQLESDQKTRENIRLTH